ncbi:unnamed protein product, partial [marine sediment metagenome]
ITTKIIMDIGYENIFISFARWAMKDRKYIDLEIGLNFTAVSKKVRRIMMQYFDVITNGRDMREETRIESWRLMIGGVLMDFDIELREYQNKESRKISKDNINIYGFLPIETFTYATFWCDEYSRMEEFDHCIVSNFCDNLNDCVLCDYRKVWKQWFCHDCHGKAYICNIGEDDIMEVITLIKHKIINVIEREDTNLTSFITLFGHSKKR